MSHIDLFPRALAYGKAEHSQRLFERHKRIIEPNIQWIRDKRVLDLASNNGRWVWAALNAGATFVTGVEGRDDRVAQATRNLVDLGYGDRCRIACSDIFDFLFQSKPGEYDAVLCLGVYYHVMDHYMLMRLMAKLAPELIIIDSSFLRTFDFLVSVHADNTSLHTSALPKYKGQRAEIVGEVSLGLMIEMAANFGYRVEPIAWRPAEIQFPIPVHDYLRGRRFTLRLVKSERDEIRSSGWKARWVDVLSALNPSFAKLPDATMGNPYKDLMTKYLKLRLEYEALLGGPNKKASVR